MSLYNCHDLSFNRSNSVSTEPFELIHSNIRGSRSPSTDHITMRYLLMIIPNLHDFPMKTKSEFYDAYVHFVNLVQTQFSAKIKTFRFDLSGGGYNSNKFLELLGKQGTIPHIPCPYTRVK